MGLLLTSCLVLPSLGQPGPVIVEPRPISSAQITWARIAVASQMVSCGTDYGVTMYAMGTGRFTESNPVWAWAEHKPVAMGLTKLGTCAAVSYLLLKDHRTHPKRTIFIAVVLTSVSLWATARNAQQVRR